MLARGVLEGSRRSACMLAEVRPRWQMGPLGKSHSHFEVTLRSDLESPAAAKEALAQRPDTGPPMDQRWCPLRERQTREGGW